MDKKIKVYRAETKKARSEFTGWLRMFEPIRNLAITVGSTIMISTLIIVVIIIQAQEAARFRLDNWDKSFETWGEAWDYVNNQENYATEPDDIEVYRLTNSSNNYYNLNGTNHVTIDQTIEKIAQRAYDKDEWNTGYSDIVLTDGIASTTDLFYSQDNSYKIYDSGNSQAVYTDFEAIESYLDITRSSFEYNKFVHTDINTIFDTYKTSVELTFETASSYDFNEYIATNGEHTNVVNHLGWLGSSEDFINDIYRSVHTIEKSLKKNLPNNFYEIDLWSQDRFNDLDFNTKFEEWKAGDDSLIVDDYLADEQSANDFETWKNKLEQVNRKAWNCDDYDEEVTIDNCDFTSELDFADDLTSYLEDYYADIQNIKKVDSVIPFIGGVPQIEYLNNLITDEVIMEKTYLADLIRDEVIINYSTYEWKDIDYPGINDTEGWVGTSLYEDVLEWFNENLNDNGWKYVLKADALTGGEFNSLTGSSKVANIFENFNNTGEVLVYDNNTNLVEFLSKTDTANTTGITLRIIEVKDTFYRLDIDIDNEDSFKSVNIIDVINYWKTELNKNRP